MMRSQENTIADERLRKLCLFYRLCYLSHRKKTPKTKHVIGGYKMRGDQLFTMATQTGRNYIY